MRTRVNLMIGRFQPLTNGHLKCVEAAWKEKNIPTVIAMIETPDAKVDEKHPFPSSLLLPIYKELIRQDRKIKDIVLVKNANIVTIGELLYNMGYEIASWTCGTDRIESYEKMSSKYHEVSHLSDDFTMIEVKRGDEDISATKVRKALMDEDETTFYKLTPPMGLRTRLKTGKSIYNILREQLLKIYNK